MQWHDNFRRIFECFMRLHKSNDLRPYDTHGYIRHDYPLIFWTGMFWKEVDYSDSDNSYCSSNSEDKRSSDSGSYARDG